MAPRKEFALIFSSNPASVDVVREDFILGDIDIYVAMNSDPKIEIKFRWERKKDKFEEVAGPILDIGENFSIPVRNRHVLRNSAATHT